MTIYIVTRKSDGQEVYRYEADAPIAWVGMEFADVDHTPVSDTPADASTTPRRLSKLDFVKRFGPYFDAILVASKANVEVEKFVKMLDWATPDPDGTSVDLCDERVIEAVTKFEAAELLPVGKAQEILA